MHGLRSVGYRFDSQVVQTVKSPGRGEVRSGLFAELGQHFDVRSQIADRYAAGAFGPIGVTLSAPRM